MNEKIENQFRLALETPEEVRMQTEDLNVGFEPVQRTWEVIVKYHGNLDELREMGVKVEELIAGYAILTIPQDMVERVAALEQIEYMEKPKRFYYNAIDPREGSCIYPVTLQEPFLTGRGVLAAVLDSGIDFMRREFRERDGKSRILFLWDQTLESNENTSSPAGFEQGVEFSREEINEAISANENRNNDGNIALGNDTNSIIIASRDISGHGTAVAGIFASSNVANDMTQDMTQDMTGIFGNINVSSYGGVAPESEFLIVKLGIPGEDEFPRTTEIMRGISYVIRKSLALNRPIVINLSIGNSYGSHDGTSLLERFLDNASEIGKTVICVGSGNEANSAGHVFGNIAERNIVEWTVGEYESSLSLQLWKNYSDKYTITLRSPGNASEVISSQIETGKYEIVLEQTRVLIYVGDPTPYSVNQEIYLEFLPAQRAGSNLSGGGVGRNQAAQIGNRYINSGVWQLQLQPVRIVTGEYSLYLPGRDARNSRTGFLRPTPQATFTIPSTASKVLTVGAYDSTYEAYADFSGRGYADAGMSARFTTGYGKPDIAAPGVEVLAPSIYGGYDVFTGTSFATPIVAGAAALLMEWGIVRGNDPYLYGEKVKAYLQKGARPLPGITEYPNPLVGYGALCVEESLPG